MLEEIKISMLGNAIALKAKRVLETKRPEYHTMFNKSFGTDILTSMLWYDGNDVLIEMLDPIDLETKNIYKINFNGVGNGN
jgi:hypothetical protein